MIKSFKLNGQIINYNDDIIFIIQYGKGKKGRYKTKYILTGNLEGASRLYDSVRIYPGWKKRLLAPGLPKQVLSQQDLT